MKTYRVEIYRTVNGFPTPIELESIEADTDISAAEKLIGGKLVRKGSWRKLAAFVWPDGDPTKMVSFFWADQASQ
jgi:hypothetical protein